MASACASTDRFAQSGLSLPTRSSAGASTAPKRDGSKRCAISARSSRGSVGDDPAARLPHGVPARCRSPPRRCPRSPEELAGRCRARPPRSGSPSARSAQGGEPAAHGGLVEREPRQVRSSAAPAATKPPYEWPNSIASLPASLTTAATSRNSPSSAYPSRIGGIPAATPVDRDHGEAAREMRRDESEAPARRAGTVDHHERRPRAGHLARDAHAVRRRDVSQHRPSLTAAAGPAPQPATGLAGMPRGAHEQVLVLHVRGHGQRLRVPARDQQPVQEAPVRAATDRPGRARSGRAPRRPGGSGARCRAARCARTNADASRP